MEPQHCFARYRYSSTYCVDIYNNSSYNSITICDEKKGHIIQRGKHKKNEKSGTCDPWKPKLTRLLLWRC
jgi:hypothetical protein